jgi:hypothetical protein
MKYILLLLTAMPLISLAQQTTPSTMKQEQPLTCKLSGKELQQRKATIIAHLKAQVHQKQSLPNGYAYRFNGSDTLIDELTDFIKTERQCCDFFNFNLQTKGDRSTTWLHITGPHDAKTFIDTELGL